MILEFFRWWYGAGWVGALRGIQSWAIEVTRAFSMGQLASTLFAPWRRIISVAGAGIDAKVRAAMDNLVSRIIGFFVRFFVLLTGCLAVVAASVMALAIAVVWPVLPLAAVYCVVRSITG